MSDLDLELPPDLERPDRELLHRWARTGRGMVDPDRRPGRPDVGQEDRDRAAREPSPAERAGIVLLP